MNAQSAVPPRVAAGLLALFTDYRHGDAVLGDLEEEFAVVAGRSGPRAARRWYWRQAIATIPHIVRASVRLAPWTTAALVASGLVAVSVLDSAAWQGARLLLASWNAYDYISAPRFWLMFDVFRYVALPITLGRMLARVARGREMVATSLVAAAMIVLFVWNVAVLLGYLETLARLRWQAPIVARVVHMGITVPLAILVGGILGRWQGARVTIAA